MRRFSQVCLLAASGAAALTLGVGASQFPGTDVHLQLANQLFAEARYDEALRSYQLAATSAESGDLLRARMGVVRSALRVALFGLARLEADRMVKQAPRNPEAMALNGDALWAAGLFEESERAFEEALVANPESARARHGHARSLAARHRFDEALDEAHTALKSAPRDGEIYHTIGSIYERSHRYEEAAAAYTNYVNLLPNRDRSEKAMWSRAQVRFLRSFGNKAPFQFDGNPESMLHTVDFKLINDKVIVRARVNNGSDMDFIVDTGSEQTVISRTTAQKVGVTPIVYTLSAGVGEVGLRGLQLGRLDSFEVGTLKVRNLPVLIKNPPLKDLPTRESESFSPLALGLSMTIDYGSRKLTIGQQVADGAPDFELPMRLHRLAMVRGMIDGGYAAPFVVDTGGEVISISTDTADALDRQSQRRIPLKVYGTSGWDRDAFLLPGVDLDFNQIQYRNFPVVVLNLRAPSVLLGFQVGGIVGHRFLSKYRVSVDIDRSVLRMKAIDGRTTAH
jgi:Flp pilus assembly protein TadD/predicted aspartyl protease